MTIKLILASGSPRRKELLANLGVSFQVQVSDVDETLSDSIKPSEAVLQLARKKATAIAKHVTNALVIGVDTVVVRQGHILGKPRNREHAIQMLSALQNANHQVLSGIALIEVKQGQIQRVATDYRKTDVTMLPLTSEQIAWYVDTGEPMDKAGAYGIQGKGACLIDRIDGCYFNVVGMSVVLLRQMMENLGYDLFQDFVN